jgi:putative serine protease PepD
MRVISGPRADQGEGSAQAARAAPRRAAAAAAAAAAPPPPPVRRRAVAAAPLWALAAAALTSPRAAALADDDDARAPEAYAAAAAAAVVAVGTTDAAGAFTALASGVVWDAAGHVVTAYSPLNTALRQGGARPGIALLLPDGGAAVLAAEVVSREPSLELLVLRVAEAPPPGAAFAPLPLARSGALRLGQSLYAVGAAPGGGRALAAGVLSAARRSVSAPNGQTIGGCLQTDADFAPLALGGALVDSGGQLVGVPIARFARPGAPRGTGIGFAIGSDKLLEAVPMMIAYGNAAGRR